MTALETNEWVRRASTGPTLKDLRGAVGGSDIANCVIQAMREFGNDELDPVAAANAGTAYQARQMLAVITYCYAVGTYRSQDIEATMREDVLFRLACGNEFPGWRMIRRFRRLNREAIRFLLEETFRRAWGINGCASPRFAPGSDDRPEWRNGRNNGHSDANDFITAEAIRRIEEACRIDTMDDEDD